MAKKLPIVPVAIGLGAGVATYFAATQLSQRVAFMQQHPLAAPLTLAAVGVLVAKKHIPIGLGIAGAAGAIGYLQYKAGTSTTPVASTVAPATTPAAQTTTTPATTPASTTTPGATTDNTATTVAQQGINALTGDQSGTSTGTGTDTTGTGTGTAGYSAGKLLSGPHMHSHLANWRSRQNAGALLSGPRPHSHLAPWHRNAGHYDQPAPGEAGGLRGGAHGLTSD